MNRKRLADIMICALSVAIEILVFIYLESNTAKQCVTIVGTGLFLIFSILTFMDVDKSGQQRRKKKGNRIGSGSIHTLILLDENDEPVSDWNIAGKVSLLIGRDTQKEDVDINLANTAFAGMVDRQHAVMNYTAGQWYIEDLDSANGIRIRKSDSKIYEVSKNQPCQIEKGDILIIGLTKLLAE